MKAVFLDFDTVNADDDMDTSALQALEKVDWSFFGATSPDEVAGRLQGCAVAVVNKVVLNAEALTAASDTLRLVVIAATGTNNIDLEAARRLGISVCNARDYSTPAVVQHVYALILALTTQLPHYLDAVASGRWQRHPQFCILDYPIRELAGRNLGIIGYGALGRGVAEIAPAFGMNVLISARPGSEATDDRVPLEQVLRRADILSLHCPLTETTRNLIGASELALMKPDALLINTARGGIVDETALVSALRTGEIGGAGFDVLIEEPPANGNVLLDAGLPNLIVTPHIAWASRESRQRVVDIVARNIAAWAGGKPVNVV